MKKYFNTFLALITGLVFSSVVFSSTPAVSYPVGSFWNNPIVRGVLKFDNGAILGTGTFSGNATFSGNLTLSGSGLKLTNYSDVINANLGTISATTSVDKIIGIVPRNGTITAIKLAVNTTVSAHDTNFWTFAVTNRTSGAGTTVLLTASDANTTKATGGSALTAYTARSMTLTGTTADLNVSAGDLITLTATKDASASNLVDLTASIVLKDR